jgi:hypothetical protein
VAGSQARHKGYAERMTERVPPPHNEDADEPLGPLTPDTETPLGDTPEAHDELSPVDLPPDHPGRKQAERDAGGVEGETTGNT